MRNTCRTNRYTRTVKERFEEKYVKTDSCWIWTASKHPRGYGNFLWKEKQESRAHRVAYIMYVGDIPKGSVIRHMCDNPSCVNPSHLLLGSQYDNVQDCIQRGRGKHSQSRNIGSKNPASKISEKDALEIKASKLTGVELSKIYGLCSSHISAIRRGKKWRSVNAS